MKFKDFYRESLGSMFDTLGDMPYIYCELTSINARGVHIN